MTFTRPERLAMAARKAEDVLLSALVAQPETRAMVVGRVEGSDFSTETGQELFDFIMAGPEDPALLFIEACEADLGPGVFDALADTLSEPDGGLPSVHSVQVYADKVHESGLGNRLRRLAELEAIATSGEAVRMPDGTWLDGNPSLRQISARFAQARKQLTEGGADEVWTPLYKAAEQGLDEVEAQERGEGKVLSCGIDALDDVLDGGFRPGDLIIISGLPSRGKTLVALQLASHFSAAGDHPGAIVSLEMGAAALAKRALSTTAMVKAHHIRRAMLDQDEWTRLVGARDDFERHWAPMQICDRPGLDHNDIRAYARPLWARDELDYLVVDYLTLMKEDGRSRTEGVGANSTGLKGIAGDYDCAVICLAQMNRDYEAKLGKNGEKFTAPLNKHLRDSGQIEQDADVIIFVDHDKDTGEGVLHITKQRSGRLQTVRVLFDLEHSMIADHPDEPAVFLPRTTKPGTRRRSVKPQLGDGFVWEGENVRHMDSNRLAWRGDSRAWWSESQRGVAAGAHWVYGDVDPIEACALFLEARSATGE